MAGPMRGSWLVHVYEAPRCRGLDIGEVDMHASENLLWQIPCPRFNQTRIPPEAQQLKAPNSSTRKEIFGSLRIATVTALNPKP